ncbi:hypothetical protein, partial [Leptospira bourretii]
MKHPAISEHTKGKYRPLFISKFLHDQEKIESAKGLFGYFLGLLYERGFSVSFNNDKTISDKSLVSKRRKLELEEYNQKVKNASDQVSEVTSKYITKNGACNEAEYYSNLKFHFKKLANFRANNQDSLKDFNFLVDSGNDCHYWLNKIQNFRLAFGSETFAQNLDSSEQYSKLKVQRNYYY